MCRGYARVKKMYTSNRIKMIRGGNLKKILIILCTFISIVSTLTSCFAFQMEDVNIHKLYSCGELMKYKGVPKVADYAVIQRMELNIQLIV